jgi:hypothetical protein
MKLQRIRRFVPTSERIKHDDLSPDNIRIVIDWENFVTGASVFVPAVNVTELTLQFYELAHKKKFQIEHRVRIENGRWGVRFWRMS